LPAIESSICSQLVYFPFAFTGKLIEIKSLKEKVWEYHKFLDPMDPNSPSQAPRKGICHVVIPPGEGKESSRNF